MRTLHILAGVAWVGGSLTYLLVIIPALRLTGAQPATAVQIAILFKRLVNVCIGLLLISGVYLMFARLALSWLEWPYLVVLVIKTAFAILLFLLALYIGRAHIRRLAKQTSRFAKIAPYLVLALGILVFLLGALLNAFYTATLALH